MGINHKIAKLNTLIEAQGPIDEIISEKEALDKAIMSSQLYTGIWFDKKKVETFKDSLDIKMLTHTPADDGKDGYHMTLKFKPKDFERILPEDIGKEVSVKVTHIMIGEGVIGLKVSLDDPLVDKLYSQEPDKEHITLSYAEGHFPKETGNIPQSCWIELAQEIELTGQIGFKSYDGDIVLSKTPNVELEKSENLEK